MTKKRRLRTTESCSTAATIQPRLLLHTETTPSRPVSVHQDTHGPPRPRRTALPVDGHHGKAAAAAAGEGIRRNPLSGQSCQHTSFAPKEVGDEAHELDQGYGVIPAENGSSAEPVRGHPEVRVSTGSNSQRSHEVTE